MIAIVKTISTRIDKTYRLIKALVFGKTDAREAHECTDFGIDSNPIKGMDAIYASTSVNGIPVIIGYLNKNQLAATGETRLFSTDANGGLKFNVWLQNDGKMLMGTSATPSAYVDNLVRYEKLKLSLDTYFTGLNSSITTAISGLGGAYIPPAPFDPSLAKITEIKTQ